MQVDEVIRKCSIRAVRNYDITVDIDAPPQRVWEVMIDVERWHEWTPSITSIKRLDSGELREGSRVRIKQPKLAPTVMTVSDLEPGRSFTWKTRAPGLEVTANHSVVPLGKGSQARLTLFFGGIVGGLLGRAMRNLNERYVGLEAAGLKKRSESPPATARLR